MKYIFLVMMIVGGSLAAAQDAERESAIFSIAKILKDDKITSVIRGDHVKSAYWVKKPSLYEYDNLNAIATAKDTDLPLEPEFKRMLLKHGLIKQFEQTREQNRTLKKPNTAIIKKFMTLGGNKFTLADLQSAIYNENTDAAKIILELDPELLDQQDEKGQTPLVLAASLYKGEQEPSRGFTEFVHYLLEIGANSSSLPTENISPNVAGVVQRHQAQRKELLANIAALNKVYGEYKQFAGRAIILPKPHKQRRESKPLQRLEEIEKKYATTDLATLPTSKIAQIQGTYARAQEACFERPMETGCSICQDTNTYKTKTPVIVCTKKHTVCTSCFSVPALQSCPLCREKFSNNEKEFWKPIQLDFCQTCSGHKDTLGFTFCNDCKHVGVVCADCNLVSCCKKQRIALSSNTINNCSTYFDRYIDHEGKQRETDRSILDKSWELQKQEIEREAIEKLTDLKKRHERVRTKRDKLYEKCITSKASIDQAQQNHQAWVTQVNTELEMSGNSNMYLFYKIEDKKRNAKIQKEIDEHNTLREKLNKTLNEENELVDAYNANIKEYRSRMGEAESIYLTRLQKRKNYSQELKNRILTLFKNS